MSIFESFNARYLSPKQVAQTFIPPAHFEPLTERSHSLVIGPRGSGKTTLLKMLQPLALTSWAHPNSRKYQEKIEFLGVFVGADVAWGESLESVTRNELPKSAKQQLGAAAFTSHVLIALANTIQDCRSIEPALFPHLHISMSRDEEAVLSAILAKSWKLEPPILSLGGIIISLRDRLSAIQVLASQLADMDTLAIKARLESLPELHLDFVSSAVVAIESISQITRDMDRQWAFLFDELEIAPRFVRRILFKSLRSMDRRILLKLSISPYSEDIDFFDKTISAMPGNDYSPIYLWYENKEDGYTFSRELICSLMKELCIDKEPEEVFGTHPVDQASRDAYKPHGHQAQAIQKLRILDKSFHDYLLRNSISEQELNSIVNEKRAQVLRKPAWPILLRAEYLGQTPEGAHKSRSRKNPGLYHGLKVVFAVTEGNPRWLIGLTRPILMEFKQIGRSINPARQSEEIRRLSSNFRAMLKILPYDNPIPNHRKRGLLTLLDDIGKSLADHVYGEAFIPEPPGSFIVDSTANEKVISAVGKALNTGALVYIRDEDATVLSSIRGKRFRLSYILAQHYRLPLTLGKPVALSRLLRPKLTNEEFQFSFEGGK